MNYFNPLLFIIISNLSFSILLRASTNEKPKFLPEENDIAWIEVRSDQWQKCIVKTKHPTKPNHSILCNNCEKWDYDNSLIYLAKNRFGLELELGQKFLICTTFKLGGTGWYYVTVIAFSPDGNWALFKDRLGRIDRMHRNDNRWYKYKGAVHVELNGKKLTINLGSRYILGRVGEKIGSAGEITNSGNWVRKEKERLIVGYCLKDNSFLYQTASLALIGCSPLRLGWTKSRIANTGLKVGDTAIVSDVRSSGKEVRILSFNPYTNEAHVKHKDSEQRFVVHLTRLKTKNHTK